MGGLEAQAQDFLQVCSSNVQKAVVLVIAPIF
jgi:hypothetical protein